MEVTELYGLELRSRGVGGVYGLAEDTAVKAGPFRNTFQWRSRSMLAKGGGQNGHRGAVMEGGCRGPGIGG